MPHGRFSCEGRFPGLEEPNLFWDIRRTRTPTRRRVHRIAHLLKPPLCPQCALSTNRDPKSRLHQTQFELPVVHSRIFHRATFCARGLDKCSPRPLFISTWKRGTASRDQRSAVQSRTVTGSVERLAFPAAPVGRETTSGKQSVPILKYGSSGESDWSNVPASHGLVVAH